MRVIVFTQYFTPEIGAAQTRLHTFAAGLAERGHEVTVICEVPNHPQGVVRPGFDRRALVRRALDGFSAWYVWVHTTPVKTTRTRLLFYGTYAAASALAAAIHPRPDVIFASSPPLPVAAAAAAAAKRHRVPWVLDVRDLWPAAAVALGELSNERVLRFAERLERWLYADAAAITTVTAPFIEHIAERTADPDKVALLPNGTTRFWVEGSAVPPDRAAVDLPRDRFVWTFAGHVGAAQGLEAAVDAAAELDDRFLLVILGDGPTRAALEQRAAERCPGRVLFRGQVPQDVALRYLRSSDCLLVPLAEHPSLASFVPSKLFDFCAVGRPVIVAAAGEPQRLAGSTAAALPVSPGDPRALARGVRQVRDDPALADRLAAAGAAFGRDRLRDRQVDRLAVLLEAVTARGR